MPKDKFTDLRRKGRAAALQRLYAADVRGGLAESSLEWLVEEDQLPERAISLAQKLIQGVKARGQALDSIIQQYAPAWPVAQLAPVDRNILRIALLELLHSPDTPDSTPSPGSNSESTPMEMTTIAAAETHRRQDLASDR